MELTGFILDVIGKLLVAYTAIAVHHRFLKEHKIDAAVFKVMHREQIVGIIGVILIIAGFLLQLPFKI
jgi:hypothetical protein